MPDHPNGLSARGWRVLGALCMDLAASEREHALTSHEHARVAQRLLDASKLFATAGVLDGVIDERSVDYPTLVLTSPPQDKEKVWWAAYPGEESSASASVRKARPTVAKVSRPRPLHIHAPVPLRTAIAGRRVVEWLEGAAERRLNRLARSRRWYDKPERANRRRCFEVEEDAAESAYRFLQFGDSNWAPS